MYINDLCDKLQCNYLLYADDLKIYRRIMSVSDAVTLQRDLDTLSEWCRKNKLYLNINKCCYIHFTNNKTILSFNYQIDNTVIKRVTTVKDLGILFDAKLSFVPHIESIVSRANKMLGFILRITKDFSDTNTLKLLFYTHVRSILEYASVIWSPCYAVHINRIESIQRKFSKIICRRASINLDGYTERIAYLKIITLENRRKILDLCCLYKIKNNYYNCNFLTSLLHFNVPRRELRSASVFRLSTSYTNISFYSPINRMMRTFNKKLNDLDLLYVSFPLFKRICQVEVA